MKKSNSTKKALGAFKKLGAVALITATLAVCFTACNQTGGGGNTGGGGGKPTPTPKPKHAITFSVDSTTPNGTLKAKADGVPETATSPITVEEGKTVTFTATANAGYRVKGWTLDGSAVNGTNNSYSFTVSKAVSVKVSFEDNSTPLPKHAITFSVDGANGKLTAKADGVAETNTSPITVEEGKTVTFTAEPSTNYKVKEWKVGDTVVTGNKTNTYAHTVTKAVTVKVSFEANSNPPNPPTPTKYTVTLTQTANGKVTASPEIPADGKMPKDTEITFTAKANDGYRVNTWVISPSEALQSGGEKGNETAKVKITADTQVSVNFELIPEGVVLTLDPNKLTIGISAKTADGKPIEVEGCTETTFASDEDAELHATGTTVTLRGKITKLECNDNQLVALNVQGLTALQTLDCSENKLTELNVQGCTTLQTLECNDNQLVALNVQGLTALQTLDCSENKLTELNVQGCTTLQTLDCNKNQLTSLNVQGLTALQTLDCSENKLTELNVQGLTALQKLYCGGNQLTALDVQGLTALQELGCGDNQLTSLNLQGLTALQKLYCGGNRLTALDVQGLTALQKLDCSANQLTALNVQGLKSLKVLYCAGNQIKAQAMTELLKALPALGASDKGWATLYTEQTGVAEGNCKDYTQPEDLKTAFDEAKKRNWQLRKYNASGNWEDI